MTDSSISHALVLPDRDFNNWLQVVRPYTDAFERVAIVRSPAGNDLNRYRNVSAVTAPLTWYQDDPLRHIRRVYPMVVRVDIVQAATPIEQIDVSGVWPISARWQAVGRYNYSFLQNVPIEIIGGLQYNAGCWVLRVVGHRVQTTEADSTTRAFVQLELSDFSRLGSSPLNLLRRRIPGYGVANQPMEDSALAEQ